MKLSLLTMISSAVLTAAEFTHTTVGYLVDQLGEADAIKALELSHATVTIDGRVMNVDHQGTGTEYDLDQVPEVDDRLSNALHELLETGIGEMFDVTQEYDELSFWQGAGPSLELEVDEGNVIVQLTPFYSFLSDKYKNDADGQ